MEISTPFENPVLKCAGNAVNVPGMCCECAANVQWCVLRMQCGCVQWCVLRMQWDACCERAWMCAENAGVRAFMRIKKQAET